MKSRQVKNLLREMDALVADSEKFEPQLKVLKENVEHHAEEEEEAITLNSSGKSLKALRERRVRLREPVPGRKKYPKVS
jgi:hypothetical protein